MPVPPNENFSHYRGDTFTAVIHVWDDTAHTVPSDLTGAAVAAQIRASTSATAIIAAFDVGKSGNAITLRLPPAKVETLPQRAVYDVEVDWQADRVNVQTVLRGSFTVDPDVTRVSP